jgi:DNA-binding beta-propeller fold protein YncE
LALGVGLIVSLCPIPLPASQAQTLEFGPPFIITDGFNAPAGLGVDVTNSRIFVADTANHRLKYTSIASLQTTPVWTEFGFVSNRSLAEALNEPQAIAIDSSGNAYVVDTFGKTMTLSAGNAGLRAIGTPGIAYNVISVANVNIVRPLFAMFLSASLSSA